MDCPGRGDRSSSIDAAVMVMDAVRTHFSAAFTLQFLNF